MGLMRLFNKGIFSSGGPAYVFTQSLGVTELSTDGGFEAWLSATNLTSWTEAIGGTSSVNKESVDIHGGSFACRQDIDASNNNGHPFQAITATSGDIVEVTSWRKSIPTAKTSRTDIGTNTGVTHALTTSYQQFYELMRIPSNNPNFGLPKGSAASSSIYLDDVSIKKITPNTAQVAVADGTIDFMFTLPATPVAGQRIERWYRCAVATPTLDGWTVYLKYKDDLSGWELFVDSVVSGVSTPRKGATAVSANPTGIRVVLSGTLHDHYTFESGSWTIRGAQINNATYQTNNIINTVYNTGFTPVSSSFL